MYREREERVIELETERIAHIRTRSKVVELQGELEKSSAHVADLSSEVERLKAELAAMKADKEDAEEQNQRLRRVLVASAEALKSVGATTVDSLRVALKRVQTSPDATQLGHLLTHKEMQPELYGAGEYKYAGDGTTAGVGKDAPVRIVVRACVRVCIFVGSMLALAVSRGCVVRAVGFVMLGAAIWTSMHHVTQNTPRVPCASVPLTSCQDPPPAAKPEWNKGTRVSGAARSRATSSTTYDVVDDSDIDAERAKIEFESHMVPTEPPPMTEDARRQRVLEVLSKLPADETLMRWVNLQVGRAVVEGDPFGKRLHNFTSDVADGEVLAVLLSQVVQYRDHSKMLQAMDPFRRCELVVETVRHAS